MDQLLLWQDASKPVAENRIVQHDTQGGGMVATGLVAVARLGGRPEFWGAAGGDWMGDWIVSGLAREGVDVSQVRRIPDHRGPMVVVCVDKPTGQRHFLFFHGIPPCGEPIGSLDRLAGAGCLLVDHTRPESELRAAQEARRLGVPVVGDVGAVNDANRPTLAVMDYAIASEMCARSLGAEPDSPEACRRLLALGPRCAVVTLGDRGLVWMEGDRFGRLDAFRVDVVDTTGAGDTFHGAFCFGLACGLNLEKNLLFASATASMKCRRLGGRAGIPTLSEVLAFLAERGHDLAADFG